MVRKRNWLLLAITLGILAIAFGGLNIFRQPVTRAPNPVPVSSPPPALTTAQYYLARGDYDFDAGAYDRAITDYTDAIDLKPDFAEAYNNRAYVYMTLGKYDLALPDLEQAIQLRPEYVNALMNRGDIYNYYYEIDRERALADYDRVLAIDPDAPGHTSVCGHRLLAMHDGWNPGVLLEIFSKGARAGCPGVKNPG